MNDIKIYKKLLEDSGILIDGVTESVKHEKKQEGWFLWLIKLLKTQNSTH